MLVVIVAIVNGWMINWRLYLRKGSSIEWVIRFALPSACEMLRQDGFRQRPSSSKLRRDPELERGAVSAAAWRDISIKKKCPGARERLETPVG
jgi:hypothetical protein